MKRFRYHLMVFLGVKLYKNIWSTLSIPDTNCVTVNDNIWFHFLITISNCHRTKFKFMASRNDHFLHFLTTILSCLFHCFEECNLNVRFFFFTNILQVLHMNNNHHHDFLFKFFETLTALEYVQYSIPIKKHISGWVIFIQIDFHPPRST